MSEMGESAKSASVKIDSDKYLKAKVTKITFNKVYKACRSESTISAPHWPSGKPDGFRLSKKPAVLQLGKGKACTAEVSVLVDSKGLSGKGALTGTLNDLVFEGSIPLASGEHTVAVTLKQNPQGLSWDRGSMLWEIDSSELIATAGSTLVELFFIFDDPAKRKFFKRKGVWIEALRFAFTNAGLDSIKKEDLALKEVTKM